MDHKELLDQIQKHFDYRIDDLKDDVKQFDDKLDSHSDRLVKLENEQGWIKRGLMGIIATASALALTYVKKLFNFGA